MNFYSISSLVASVFCIILGTFVFLKRIKDKRCKVFATGCIVTGLWTSFPFALSISPNEKIALLLSKLTYIPAAFTGIIWLHFLFLVANEELTNFHKKILKIFYLISFLFIPIIFTKEFIKGTLRFEPFFAVIPGPLYPFFVLIFVIIFILALQELLSKFKITYGYRKNQLKFIFLAYFTGVASATFHFLAAYIKKEPFPHDLLLIAYTGIFAYAILKHRLMDITLVLTRAAVFIIVYGSVLGLPYLLITFGKHKLIQFLGHNWFLFPIILLTLLAFFGPFIYITLEQKAEATILRQQHNYRKILEQAAKQLASIHNLTKLLKLVVHLVNKTVGINHSAIYLYDEESKKYILKATRNYKPQQEINEEEILVKWLKINKQPLVYYEIKNQYQTNQNLQHLISTLENLKAEVIIPGFLREKLLGFLILGTKKEGFYTQEDLNTFSLLANEVALAVENAQLYENMEQQIQQKTKQLAETQKQLFQAEKLASIGTLAGGVAHEINNPLTAILTNTQLLLMDAHTEEEKESLKLIEQATHRCRDIVKKLMIYARKPLEDTKPTKVNLLDVVKNSMSLLEYQLKQENINIIYKINGENFHILGIQNELEQVVTNIVLNARDAIKKIKNKGNIEITLNKNKENVELTIKDDGVGIPKEIISKIFDPFFTTKEVGKGTGLGLSICQSIIEKHNGKILVESEPNKGAKFTIKLPLLKEN